MARRRATVAPLPVVERRGRGPGSGGRASTAVHRALGERLLRRGRTTPRTEACPPGQRGIRSANRNAAPLVSGFGFISGSVAQTDGSCSRTSTSGKRCDGASLSHHCIDVAGGGTSASSSPVAEATNALANDGESRRDARHQSLCLRPEDGARTDWPPIRAITSITNDLVVARTATSASRIELAARKPHVGTRWRFLSACRRPGT